jgi:hypothetical protein
MGGSSFLSCLLSAPAHGTAADFTDGGPHGERRNDRDRSAPGDGASDRDVPVCRELTELSLPKIGAQFGNQRAAHRNRQQWV